MSDEIPRQAYYVTALDRIGLATLAGGVLVGLVVSVLIVAGGRWSPAVLGFAWVLGTLAAMVGIVAVLGPIWLLLHRANRRGAGVAATAAAAITLIVFTAAQVSGAAPEAGGGYRLVSALASGAFPALVAAAIGMAMQRVAYRRLL